MKRNSNVPRYRASFTVVMSFFLTANYLHYATRARDCDDCLIRNGLPFAFMARGGYSPVYPILWWGAAADVLTVFAATVIVSKAWQYCSDRMSA